MKILWIMLMTIVGLSTKQLAVVVCVLLLLLFADATRDYYEILGVLNSATGRQIKKAFHKLAVKYHPDKNSNPEAEDVFREIAEAYQVLSNNEQRKFYDQHSHEADVKQGDESFYNFGFGEDQYDETPVYVWSSPMQDQGGAQQDQGFFDGNYFGFRDSVHDVNEDYSDDWFQAGTEYGFCWLVNTADGSTVKLCEVN